MQKWKRLLLSGLVATVGAAPALGQREIGISVGRWRLNVEESKFEPAPLFKGEDRLYEDWGGGLIHARFEGIDAQGKPTYREYVARLDGKDYPWVRRGAKTAWTIALKPIDARTFAYTAKEDGRVVQTGTHTVSTDGAVMTVTYKFEAPNAQGQLLSGTLVFERQ